MKKVLTFALMILAFSLALSGCQTKNPSEKTDLTQDLDANTQNNETTPNQETTPNDETIPADDTPVQEQHNWWEDMEQKHIVPLSDDIAPEDAPYAYYPDAMYFYLIDNSYKSSEKLASWYPIERRTEDTAPVEITDTLLERIKETINQAEERCPALIYDEGHGEPALGRFALVFEDCWGASMVGVVSDYDTLEKVCDAMKDVCSPVVAQKLMNEDYVHSLNGRIYFHAAGGMPTCKEVESISREDVTEVVGNTIKLTLKRPFYYSDDDYLVYSYTVLVGEDETVYVDDYDIISPISTRDNEPYIYGIVPQAVDIPW